jgi:MFS family permease
MLARFLQGAAGGTVWTIGLALLVETVGQRNLGKTIGMIFSFVSVAGLFSPIVGGLLYAKTGYTGVFGVGVGLVAMDFIMRLFMIEKKVAAKYLTSETPSTTNAPDAEQSSSANESTPLLRETSSLALDGSSPDKSPYYLPEPKNRILKKIPILLAFRDPAILTALFMGFIQALLLGAFDATVPLMAATRYGFDSLKDGLLFLPLGCSDFFLGPIFGWVVDRWGTKPISVLGFLYFIPALVLLRLPVEDPSEAEMPHQIALYASLLGLNGIGLAIINSPSIVECGAVMEKYTAANPQLFEQPPYAQLYGLTSMSWSLGLTVGPLVGGKLKESIGYGDMNAVLAGVCGVTAVLAWCFVGGKGSDVGINGVDGVQNES